MDNEIKEHSQYKYNHGDVIGGVLFLIIVFAGMAIAAHYIN